MDRKELFPPHMGIQPQYFSPPSVIHTPSFPPPSFHIPPPIVPLVPVESQKILDVPNVETIITCRRKETARSKTDRVVSQIKVHEFSQQIQGFYHSLNRLKNLLEEYKLHQNDNIEATHNLRAKIIAEQEYISNLKASSMTTCVENIQILKRKISQRRRKRKKKFIRPTGFNAHKIAADHMHHLLRIATDLEQDERLKKDADNILSNVLRKKNEANHCIQLLNSLERLHTARCNSIGTDPRNSGFNAVIKKLRMLWEAQLQEYAVEENGFRIMIEELAVDRKKERNENTDKIFEEWCKSMFGVSDSRAFSYFANMDNFIWTRHAWDKYVVEGSDVNSKIPPGWVLPENRCGRGSWEKFICK